MGLFASFKKKEPSHSEKLNLAYRCYRPEMVGMIFPGGKEQANRVIISLGKIYNLDLETSDAKRYYEVLTTYSDIVIRLVITHSSNETIIASLQVNHKDLVKSKEIARKTLAYVMINMKNNSFALDSEEDMEALSFMAEAFSSMEETTKQNNVAETENLEDTEYGLVETKPIYTHDVGGSNKYLQSLKTINGETLTWNRLGSISVRGIKGIVDVYESTLPSGDPYKTLYLNMYGSVNSEKIPKGFKKDTADDMGLDLKKEADEKGVTVKQLLAIRKMEEENEELKKQAKKEEELRYLKQLELSKIVKEKYTDFDFNESIKDPVFSKLVNLDYDMTTVYEFVERERLFNKNVVLQKDYDSSPTADEYYAFLCNFEKDNIPAPDDYSKKPLSETEKEANELNITVDQLMSIRKMETEHYKLKMQLNSKEFRKTAEEAVAVKSNYPLFNLKVEWGKEEFRKIAKLLSLTIAYEFLHFQELYTKKDLLTEEKQKVLNTMYCRKCGQKIPPDSVFCYRCGTKVIKEQNKNG